MRDTHASDADGLEICLTRMAGVADGVEVRAVSASWMIGTAAPRRWASSGAFLPKPASVERTPSRVDARTLSHAGVALVTGAQRWSRSGADDAVRRCLNDPGTARL